MTSLFILLMIFLSFCADISAKHNTAFSQSSPSSDSCYKWEDIERMKNKQAVVFGFLRKFTPFESGKGVGHMFWQWEIVLYGNGRIPVTVKAPAEIPFEKFSNSEVVIYGKVFYGIIIGDDNPNHQSMTGYRIDVDSIFIDHIDPVYEDLQEVKKVFRDTCRTYSDAEKLKNADALIYGRLQKFTPWQSGKGSGHMFWQWEIKLADGFAIPVVNKNLSDGESIPFAEFESRNVVIFGKVFYGIIIGDDNPNHQSMTGYRIDADGIEIIESDNIKDTCWVYADVQSFADKDVIIAGRIVEYVPPGDGSKLGDEKIWDYELVTQDNYRVPIRKDKYLSLEKYLDKDVFIYGYIKYGIIFGEPNTTNMQGYRVDVFEVSLNQSGYGNTLIEGKIRIDLTKFNDEGYRVYPDGEKSATSYEFCIPANDSVLAEVKSIDPAAGEMKGSKGRSGCSDEEWLVISSTRKPGFKEIIRKLAELKYIRKITETFWE